MMLNAADTAPVAERWRTPVSTHSENAEKARPTKGAMRNPMSPPLVTVPTIARSATPWLVGAITVSGRLREIKYPTIMPAPTMNTRSLPKRTAEITSRKSDRLSRAVPTYRSQLPA